MKIVIAPDSFKESLSAENVVRQLKPGFRPSFPMRTISVCR
nr:glycerate kinase [Escherichia coli]